MLACDECINNRLKKYPVRKKSVIATYDVCEICKKMRKVWEV